MRTIEENRKRMQGATQEDMHEFAQDCIFEGIMVDKYLEAFSLDQWERARKAYAIELKHHMEHGLPIDVPVSLYDYALQVTIEEI